MDQIVLGTLKNIVGNTIGDYDNHFELECETAVVLLFSCVVGFLTLMIVFW